MVLPILIRWVLGRGGRSIPDEELKRLEEEAKRGRLPVTFWNEESAREWYRELRKMLGKKAKYRDVLAGDLKRTYYMLPHIPHAWKILERVGAMKDVMSGLIINDEVMDKFYGLEPAHISWAWMMGARTPEELKVLGGDTVCRKESTKRLRRADGETLPEDGSGICEGACRFD